MDKLMFFSGLVIIMMSIGALFYVAQSSERISGKKLCVDGHGDINLEGLMCEKEYISYFGAGQEDSLIFGALGLLMPFLFFLIGGMITLNSFLGDN